MALTAKTIFKANFISLVSLFAFLLLASPANAKMYKWVDQDGVTHYTQHPPIKQNSTQITKHSPPGKNKEQASQTKQSKNTNKHKNKNKAQNDTSQAKKDAKKSAQCAHVKNNLQMLEKSLNIVRKKVKGKLVAMTEIERKQLIGQYRATISQHCQ
ncbi:hypothetical protein MNBD_GAMMA12-2699 [hydrothermal vent metagenome]|uniref:DUF4124 domain-containing protein n=1 Tax=hydrothermal vent metagenome TaxID=652676 RepID=A0A3B0Z0N3_9ZZZZ